MKNSIFDIEIDKSNGCITSIVLNGDKDKMNWCNAAGKWGKIYKKNWKIYWDEEREGCFGNFDELDDRKAVLSSFNEENNRAVSEYKSDDITVTVTRYFKENGNLVENFVIKNISDTVVCLNRDNFGIETPFNADITVAPEALTQHCNAHFWCGHNICWVNALKMGNFENNLGLYLRKGAIESYDQNEVIGKARGIFVLGMESVLLNSGDEYEIEWELFCHKGTDDFFEKLAEYENYIGIKAKHYTVFENEPIEFTVSPSSDKTPVIKLGDEEIIAEKCNTGYKVTYIPSHPGEYKFNISVGDVSTSVTCNVKIAFKELLEKRIHFIIKNQQCLDPKSPLYGAFLVYDNEIDSMYFDYTNGDHNACRERMNIPLLLMKYLQIKDDPEVKKAIDLYMNFVFREFYEETTGEVFNTIGKNRDALRLYNAPGVMLLFCEMYFVTRDESYLDHILKLAEKYYTIGGEKCYANGIAICKNIKAFRMAGREKDAERMLELFKFHVDNIISNDINYPPHEAVYEQTILTPVITHISEMGILSDEKERYLKEVKKHLPHLERFSGMQPDFHLYEIAIRFWDDFWFGKYGGLRGDTLPHHLSVLTARSYIAYSRLSGEKKWLDKAEECIRNCMCLISDDGRGSAAYIYPHRLDGEKGEFFDDFSNDQDLVLYDALYCAEYSDTFKI